MDEVLQNEDDGGQPNKNGGIWQNAMEDVEFAGDKTVEDDELSDEKVELQTTRETIAGLNDFIEKARKEKDYDERQEYSVPVELLYGIAPILNGLKKNIYDYHFDYTNSKYVEWLDNVLGVTSALEEDFSDDWLEPEEEDAYNDAAAEKRLERLQTFDERGDLDNVHYGFEEGFNVFDLYYDVVDDREKGYYSKKPLTYTRNYLSGGRDEPSYMTVGLAELLKDKLEESIENKEEKDMGNPELTNANEESTGNTGWENMDEYRKVNTKEYVEAGLADGSLEVFEATKHARIAAEQGRVGEEVISWSEDENGNPIQERVSEVKIDEETGEPGWIVTKTDSDGNPIIDRNGHTNQWIIGDKKFKQKYEVDPENPSIFRPVGGPQKFVETHENLTISQWGDEMKMPRGSFINITKPDDMYAVNQRDFHDTYTKSE